MDSKRSQAEADALIAMPKRKLHDEVIYLAVNRHADFVVVGDTLSDRFIINIDIKGKYGNSLTIQGRTEDDNIVLMRLDVNPALPHANPDGTKLVGSHLHVYNEEYGDKMAVQYNIEGADFEDYCLRFFEEFQVVEYPEIRIQEIQRESQ